jgi:hypothetical protein
VVLASVAAAVLSLAAGAEAQATRTWVSGVGDDVNPCSRTAPCKTFAGAISKTADPGEISVLDPGGFGSVTITKSITIDGNGHLASILASGTNGIIINAPGKDVTLRNLSINGASTGLTGISIIAASLVSIENCQIFDFQGPSAGRGITDGRTSGHLAVVNSSVNNSASTGIMIYPGSSTVTATLDRVVMVRNGTAGFAVAGGAKVVIRDSVASGNAWYGYFASNSTLTLDSSTAAHSDQGISSQTNAVVRLNNSTITGNGTGLFTATGGAIQSYGDNRIDGNGSDGSPTSISLR